MKSTMTILGIDTSCDDTAVATLQVKSQKSKGKSFEILSNVVSSQVKLHAKYGGVYPMLAKREHQRNLTLVLEKALKQATYLKPKGKDQKAKDKVKIKKLQKILQRDPELLKKTLAFLQKCQKPKIDAIAITFGPGLEPCLWQGINFAKALSYWWDLPIIPVNHIEGHVLANWIGPIGENSKSEYRNPKQIQNTKLKTQNEKIFPAIALVVSGGHTQLVLISKIGQYQIIGQTRDDAAGECFDKTARILGLGYPGGPAIALCAQSLHRLWAPGSARKAKDGFSCLKPQKISLPRPMMYTKNYDFSFSGLKTAVLYNWQKQPVKIRKSKEYIGAMAKEIQQAIIDVLIKKTLKASQAFSAKTIILAGGVAANQELRKQFGYKLEATNYKLKFLTPSKILCADNGAMIAIAGYFNQKKATKNFSKLEAQGNLHL